MEGVWSGASQDRNSRAERKAKFGKGMAMGLREDFAQGGLLGPLPSCLVHVKLQGLRGHLLSWSRFSKFFQAITGKGKAAS